VARLGTQALFARLHALLALDRAQKGYAPTDPRALVVTMRRRPAPRGMNGKGARAVSERVDPIPIPEV